MIESAHHRAEESAGVAIEFLVVEFGRRIIDASIGPLIIGREHHEMLFQSFSPGPVFGSGLPKPQERQRQ